MASAGREDVGGSFTAGPCQSTRFGCYIRDLPRNRGSLPMKELLLDASNRAVRYLSDLPSRAVAPSAAAIAGLRALDEPLPIAPSDAAETLRRLDEIVSP